MSETKTIEERYEKFKGYTIHGDWGEQMMALLDDLMAERGKKRPVNLDEIFPKEVMRQAPEYTIERDLYAGFSVEEHGSPEEGCMFGAVANYFEEYVSPSYIEKMFEDGLEVEFVAYSDYEEDCELARVRVRLGLTVEIVEDK